jgi:high-affinity iron transporter
MILNFRHRALRFAALLSIAAALQPGTVFAQSSTLVEAARRLASITSIAIGEYALGVEHGQIIKPDEFNEATLFLKQAHGFAGQLPEPARAAALATVERLQSGVAAHRPAEELRQDVTFLRSELERTLGVALDPMPSAPPSLTQGKKLFGAMCSQCHGASGMGDGPLAKDLLPPPANLTDFGALRGTSLLDFFRKIGVGVAGTAMPSFGDRLSVDQRWDVALYAASLRNTDGQRSRGERALTSRCQACLATLSDLPETAGMSDDSLARLIATDTHDSLGDPTLAEMVAYARTAPAAEVLGGNARLQALNAARRTKEGVADAAKIAGTGDRARAGQRALEAYLIFEGIENAVGARDVKAAAAVEQAFAHFRTSIASGTPDAIATARNTVDAALDRTVDVMSGESSPTVLFGQSLVIILREGLEAILLIGALSAVLAKSGAPERRREIGWGAGAAVVASLATAAAFATVFRMSSFNREAMEGITLLLAAAVLFSVASWLVSKIEAEKWKAFVGQQMRRALSSQGTWALAGVAFLAVYREGVETVLFYAALFGTAASPAGKIGVLIGLLVGMVLLLGVYYAINRYGLRLPLKPFFAVTGILLSVMTFSFVGKGVAELQAAGWIPAQPLRWLPSLPMLGIFPTIQTALAQGVLLLVFAVAVAWLFWLRPEPAGPAIRHPRH